MIVNVWSKFSEDFNSPDLCEGFEIHDEVKAMYYRYKESCDKYLTSIFDADMEKRRYYVYAWYAKTEPKRYFYVGKGTGSRYRHILYKIQKYKQGKQNLRFQRFSQIQDKWGIDCEMLLKGLTEYEALIFEQCKKLEFLDNGEVLLNVEGIPDEYMHEGWYTDTNENYPTLEKDPFFQRYFDDYNTPYFDTVEPDDLSRTYIYPYFVCDLDPDVISDKQLIMDWLCSQKARIYKTVSKKTKSIIVQGELRYDRYLEYRKAGKKILSSKDVVDYIIRNS